VDDVQDSFVIMWEYWNNAIVSVKITYFVDYLKLTNKVLFEKVYFSHCCEDFLGSSLPSENNMHYLGKIDIIV